MSSPRDKSGAGKGSAPALPKRSPSATQLTAAPKLAESPRKSAATLAKPVTHVAPKTPALSEALPHTPPSPPSLSAAKVDPTASLTFWQKKATERAEKAKVQAATSSTSPAISPPKPKPIVTAPAKTVAETVIERRYPLGFASEEEFRDATRPMARLARDGTVFVSGSSVTGVSYSRKTSAGSPAPFDKTSDIDIGIASRRLRSDSTQVQQSGPGTAFPVEGSALEHTRGRTREGHPIGAKVFRGIPYERTVLIRSHTPEPLRDDDE
ncbi:MAG TPA: hypothetical protein VF801_11135 [Rhodocyclaceae bacterium]